MNYHHLKVFNEVARRRNITAAAKAMRVAQSAVSVQVRALEDALGVKLFDRENKSLRLTAKGQLVADYAKQIFSTGEEMLAALRGIELGKPVLRVGATATLSRNFQISRLSPFLGRARIVIHSGSLRVLLTDLAEHQLDVVLCNHALTGDAAGTFYNHLLDEQEACIVEFAARKRHNFIFPKSLHGIEIVVPGQQSNVRTDFDALMLRKKIRPIPVVEVDDMAMLRLFARESGLPTLVPRVVVRDELRTKQLRELCRVPGVAERFYAVTARRKFESGFISELINLKQDSAR